MEYFDKLGVMIDCSRGGVPTVEMMKKLVDRLSEMGYTFLQLYTEDLFEVEGYPYFGYMRGRYTKEEIQDLDTYAKAKGIELMPCIQTLAHMSQIQRWQPHFGLFACSDTLFVGEEKTYQFIDAMFQSLSEYYTSRNIHIGMDEAFFLGMGQYLDKHGLRDKYDILCEHLNRVLEIAKKYGFKPMMWSDTFFGALERKGCSTQEEVREAVKALPKDVGVVYWEYYKTKIEEYATKLEKHKWLENEIYFAGGALSWNGFVPANEHTINAMRSSIQACIDTGVRNLMLTMWGDNGKECSYFALLPSMFTVSEFAKGNFDMPSIKEKFYQLYQIPFDDFMEVDLPNKVDDKPVIWNNPHKYMLYSDVFMGIFNQYVRDGIESWFNNYAIRLDKHTKNSDYGYIFANMKALCEALEVKCSLSIKTRNAYAQCDKEALTALIENEYPLCIQRIDVFYDTMRTLWFKENKGFGWEVHDMRLGGLRRRVESCQRRLQEYVDGKISSIPELEEKLLDFLGGVDKFDCDQTQLISWYSLITTNNV